MKYRPEESRCYTLINIEKINKLDYSQLSNETLIFLKTAYTSLFLSPYSNLKKKEKSHSEYKKKE